MWAQLNTSDQSAGRRWRVVIRPLERRTPSIIIIIIYYWYLGYEWVSSKKEKNTVAEAPKMFNDPWNDINAILFLLTVILYTDYYCYYYMAKCYRTVASHRQW